MEGDVPPLKILVADDSPRDADLEIQELRYDGILLDALVVSTEPDFRSGLTDFRPDVILCDFAFPDFDGLAALQIAKDLRPEAPFIFVTGSLTEERTVVAVKHGAVDYVLKTNLMRLPTAVRHAAAEAKERTERLLAEKKVDHLNRIRDVMAAVNSTILRLRDGPDLFREACRIASSIGSFPVAAALTVDEKADRFILHDCAGLNRDELFERLARRSVSQYAQGPGVVETSLRTLLPAVINDRGTHFPEGYERLFPDDTNVRSIGSFPLTIGDRSLGVMVLGTPEPNFFDAEEVMLVAGLAGNMSFALDLIEKQQRVDYLSYYDALTGLPNRTLLQEKLAQELVNARRTETMTAFVVVDIARLSALNSTLGEHVGDDILRAVAARLVSDLPDAQIARIAGDRFGIIVSGLSNLEPVMDVLSEGGVRSFQDPFDAHGQQIRVSARAGCAVFPNDGSDASSLFQHAEAALLSAKAAGRPYQLFSAALNERLNKRRALESRLDQAADERQFVLFYQPKTDVATRKIVGFEALIRWNDPERGLIPPSEFIPLLEETGDIVRVGRWALLEAARQYSEWEKAGLHPPRIAVNLSGVQLREEGLLADVRAAVDVFTADCGLDVEVTESMLMENFESASTLLTAIRSLGIRIFLDDFGTGYSSLAYIHRLPLDALKIDRSFIVGMTEDADKTSIVSTIISLGRALQLKIIAEGVEHEEEARLLQLLRCDQIQGYLFGKPEPADTAAALLLAR